MKHQKKFHLPLDFYLILSDCVNSASFTENKVLSFEYWSAEKAYIRAILLNNCYEGSLLLDYQLECLNTHRFVLLENLL